MSVPGGYVGDIDPARPGLEIYYGIEPGRKRGAMCLVGAATGTENLMPRFLEAAKAHVTLGEMCDVLQGVYGEYREPPIYW